MAVLAHLRSPLLQRLAVPKAEPVPAHRRGSPFREHWPRAVCRNTGSVMCAGEGTTTGTAPRRCAGVGEGPPGRTQALLPGTDCPAPRNPPDHHVMHRHDLMQSRGADGTEPKLSTGTEK